VLEPYEAKIIVIGPLPAGASAPEPVLATRKIVQELDGDWSLSINGQSFNAPLRSWQDLGVKDASSPGTYTKEFVLNAKPAGKRRVWLECANVRDYAEVHLNGVDLHARGWQPYRWDLTHALKRGQNVIEIEVSAAPAGRGPAPAPTNPGSVARPTPPAGLMGPARIVSSEQCLLTELTYPRPRNSMPMSKTSRSWREGTTGLGRIDLSQGIFLVSIHQSGSLQSTQSGPVNIVIARLSPLSCQSNQARTAPDQRRSGIG
jgi:hypothetical protein